MLVALERGERTFLGERARVRRAVALDVVDGFRDRFRRGQITEAPARHRVGFAETVDRDGEVVGFLRKRRDADVFRVVVNKLLVNFVGQNVDVFFGRDLDDAFKFFAGVDGAGRVTGSVED